jgi:hypothetical protein
MKKHEAKMGVKKMNDRKKTQNANQEGEKSWKKQK